MEYNVGLILEGGAMRCVYTAGILDYFLDNDIHLLHCYGVSAGAVSATNYISRQRGRTLRTTIDYVNDRRYCSVRNLITTGNLFGTDFLYNRIPNELDVFDYDTFKENNGKMTAVVSDVVSGKPFYKELSDLREDMQWLRASCSLPFLAQIVELDNGRYLDGGLCDSIPLQKAIHDGHQRNVVILTRPDGYQKKQGKVSPLLGSVCYYKYPKLLKESKNRHLMYNQQLKLIEEQEKLGNVFVFRPKNLFQINRMEKDTMKLKELYHQGYQDAKDQNQKLINFLSDDI